MRAPARGVAGAIALPLLAIVLLGGAWALASAPLASAADLPAPTPVSPVANAALASRGAAPAHAARAPSTASTRSGVLVAAAASTASSGAVLLLHRPSFAPATTLADELWSEFVASRRQPFTDAVALVADRLARLGWRCLWQGAWRHGQRVAPPALSDEPEATAWVALSPDAVGYVGVGAGDAQLQLVAVGELATHGHDQVWVWAEGAFPGPHRVRDGVVPAVALRALGVDLAAPRLTYYEPLSVAPLARAVAVHAPLRSRADAAPRAPWRLPFPRPAGDLEVVGQPWPLPGAR